jgi:hypothetical protein
MIIVSLNVCGSSGPINSVPMVFEFKTSREFTQFIRNEILYLFNWGHANWCTKSSMSLGLHIYETEGGHDDSYWSWEFIVPMSNTFNLGSYVTDIAIQPYMKSKTIAFVARNMKPNTRIYAYFDDTPVSEHCAPGELNTSLGVDLPVIIDGLVQTGAQDLVVKRTGNFGSELRSDEFGTLYGVFRIPEGVFRVGDRVFQLLDTVCISQEL